MGHRVLALVLVNVALWSATAAAQEPPDVLLFGGVQAAPVPAPGIDFEIGVLAVEPFALAEPVRNAPYTAEIVTDVVQELPDGNRIERSTTSSVARDSAGRVRREQALAAIGPVLPNGDVRMITISDPVAGVHYSLDPARKTAMRSRPPSPGVRRRDGPADAVAFHRRVEGPAPPDVRTEALGSREIEGVRAEGTRTVFTLPEGAIGNVRPIEVVAERWYSPDLKVVVYSRRSDPRFGETVYRLTNIVRAEPDPALFQVPADYRQENLQPMPRPFGPAVVRPRP